jgi:hypothetical protein
MDPFMPMVNGVSGDSIIGGDGRYSGALTCHLCNSAHPFVSIFQLPSTRRACSAVLFTRAVAGFNYRARYKS